MVEDEVDWAGLAGLAVAVRECEGAESAMRTSRKKKGRKMAGGGDGRSKQSDKREQLKAQHKAAVQSSTKVGAVTLPASYFETGRVCDPDAPMTYRGMAPAILAIVRIGGLSFLPVGGPALPV